MSTTRNASGKFVVKSEHPRKIRSVNLTDKAWQWLADVAGKSGISRNDYLEAMAEDYILSVETVKPESSPIMETVKSDYDTLLESRTDKVTRVTDKVTGVTDKVTDTDSRLSALELPVQSLLNQKGLESLLPQAKKNSLLHPLKLSR